MIRLPGAYPLIVYCRIVDNMHNMGTGFTAMAEGRVGNEKEPTCSPKPP